MPSFVDAGENRRWFGFLSRWLKLLLLVVALFSVSWVLRRESSRAVVEGSGAPG